MDVFLHICCMGMRPYPVDWCQPQICWNPYSCIIHKYLGCLNLKLTVHLSGAGRFISEPHQLPPTGETFNPHSHKGESAEQPAQPLAKTQLRQPIRAPWKHSSPLSLHFSSSIFYHASSPLALLSMCEEPAAFSRLRYAGALLACLFSSSSPLSLGLRGVYLLAS